MGKAGYLADRAISRAAIAGIVALSLVGCRTCDSFTGAACGLQDRLAAYSSSGEADGVIAWVSADRGEASAHNLTIEFVRWGNRHPSQMSDLLRRWPVEFCAAVRSRLLWASQNSGQPIRFDLPKAQDRSQLMAMD